MTTTMQVSESTLARNAKHNPWDRTSKDEQNAWLASGGGRPIKWTTDISKVNTVDEHGYVFVFAGGSLEGTPLATPKVRSDGKVDGRSKGARKCGNCGGSGHNARTCGQKRKGPTVLPASLRKPVAAPTMPQEATEKVSEPKVAPAVVEAPKVKQSVPAPRPMPAKKAPKVEVRASKVIKVPGKKICGKCGIPGHNARTCGKSRTVTSEGAKASGKAPKGPQVVRMPGSGKTGRLNTCGKCGGKGHNARKCIGR